MAARSCDESHDGQARGSGPTVGLKFCFMTQPIIKFENVCKGFGTKTILDRFSFSVQEGEVFCLIGGAGSGKSLTLKLLMGLMEFDAGEIFFADQPISMLNEKQLGQIRQQIGMVFQGSALFDSLNVFENIAYPLRERGGYSESEIEHIVAEKLDWVGLPGIEELAPADLSGGMKKRIGLARAIAVNPRVVLYDEPTAGLDPTNTNRIDDLILRLAEEKKVTSVLVTHHMPSVYRIATHVALLFEKHVAFQGSIDEFRRTKDVTVHKFVEGTIDD